MNFPCVVRLTLLIGLAAFALSPAQAGEIYKIDPARSTIGFKVRHMLGTAKGKFSQFAGTIDLDRDNPEKSTVKVTIQTKSVDTANRKRDNHMRTADFFDVAKFPEITFKSSGVKRTGPEKGNVTGDFTMHGVTRPVTLQVKFLGQGKNEKSLQTTRWQVTTEPLKRSSFGLLWPKATESISMISDDVVVNMEIEAAKM